MGRERHQMTEEARAGFTLVEVLVASLLFAIGMMAAMAMQYAALDGYAASRDVTNATELGHRIIEVLRAESQQWNEDGDLGNLNGVYSSGSGEWSSSLTNGSILRTLNGSAWSWTRVFDSPVDVRLSNGGARKYCVYARGGELNGNTGIFQVHLAVIYPPPNGSYPNVSDSSAGDCDISSDVGLANLNPPDDLTKPVPIESQGYRVVYMGTQIVQRQFISQGYFGS